MRHIGQQTLPSISHNGDIYTIENVRDYHWESSDSAKIQYVSLKVPLSHITKCRLYQSSFGAGHMIAHYMLGFSYINHEGYEDEIILSIEARRPAGQEFMLWKGIIPGMYSIIYIRGTPSDVLSLRKHVRHDPLISYDLELSEKKCQELFTYFSHKTNKIVHHKIRYHAIGYNCLTDLHKGLSHTTKKGYTITRWTVMAKGYVGYLKRLGIIK